MSTPQVCPIRAMSLAVLAISIVNTAIASPRTHGDFTDVISKEDKLCNTHGCAMWNKRSKQCGLIK